MARLKPYRRPDDDPLEVMPRERFERASRMPNGIKSYGQLLYEPAGPNQPPYPVILWNDLVNTPDHQRPFALSEVIYRISWWYGISSPTVEADLTKAMLASIQKAYKRALRENALYPTDSQVAQQAIADARRRSQ